MLSLSGLLALLSLLSGAGLGLSGLGLLNQGLSLNGLGLSLVDSFDKNSLVLVLITLSSHVEEMIDMVIDLSLLTILAEQSSENSLSSDPHDLSWHTSLSGTSALTWTHMSTLTLGSEVQSNSGSGVDSDWLLDDEAVLDKLSDSLSGVSKSDFAGFVRIEPDTALTALRNGSSKTSLELQ